MSNLQFARSWMFAIFYGACFVASLSAAPAADRGTELARGDRLYAQGLLADAQVAYQAAVTDAPDAFGALCRLSRVESELGEGARGEDQRKWAAAAVEHARAAVKIAPDDAQGHVWLAVALGRQSLQEGPKTRLALAREIKSEADRAIALDPMLGRAYHVRGLWNRRNARRGLLERAFARAVLGGGPKGASMENAVRDLEKAVELEPDCVDHRLELARTYAMLKQHLPARRELLKALELPGTTSARDAHYRTEAKELLARLPRQAG